MIICRTPFRISFFGGGTDYPVWYREHGGAVLSTTVDKYCYITCRYLPPFFEHHSRIVYSRVETPFANDEIEHPAVRGVLAYLGMRDGVEIHYDGDLPARTGLGSSSSFTVGLLHALYALKATMPEKRRLALDAIRVEQELLKENVGSQDQVSAAYGGFNRIEFDRTGEFRVSPIIVPRERLKLLQQRLMLFFTGLSRTASEIAKAQIQATRGKQQELKSMREMVDEAQRVLVDRGDLDSFGTLLHEGWLLKRSLTPHISTQQIDEIYEAARRAGAIGGKLLGAGGGGFILLVVPPEHQPNVREALKDLLHVPIKFETAGSQVIFYEPSGSYRPARRQAAAKRAGKRALVAR